MTSDSDTSHRSTVVVVGGGMAGLSASGELLSRGIRVILIERSKYLGGRAASHPDPKSGEMLDLGPHTVIESNHHVLKHLTRVGTRHLISFAPSLSIPFLHPDRGIETFNCPRLPQPFGFLWGLLKYRFLTVTERFQMVWLGYFLVKRDCESIPDITISDWFQQRKVSENALSVFWKPLIYAALNDHPSRLSLLSLARIFQQGLLAPGQLSGLAATDTTWGQLVVGNLPDQIIQSGGKVITDQVVRGFDFEGGKVCGVILDSGQLITADAVIAAVPPKQLAILLPEVPEWLSPALKFPGSPIVSMHWIGVNPLPVSTPLALLENPIQWIFSRNVFKKNTRVILSTITGGDREILEKSSAEITRILKEQLRQIFPEWTPGDDTHVVIRKVRNATWSLRPGQDSHRPGPATNIPDLWIAGDWTRTKLPPTLESAAVSGINTAGILQL